MLQNQEVRRGCTFGDMGWLGLEVEYGVRGLLKTSLRSWVFLESAFSKLKALYRLCRGSRCPVLEHGILHVTAPSIWEVEVLKLDFLELLLKSDSCFETGPTISKNLQTF